MQQRQTIAVGLLVAAVLLLVFGGAAVAEGRRAVWLVNGVDEAYSVDVAGEHVVLQPYAHRRVEIGTGRHEVAVHKLSGERFTVVVDDDVPFLTAPVDLLRRVHVINPDAAALVTVERTTYRETPRDGEYVIEPQLPGLLHVVDADFAFVDFPVTVDVKAGGAEERSRAWNAGSAVETFEDAKDHLVAVAEARLRFQKNDGAAAAALVGARPDAATLALLGSLLQTRPTPWELDGPWNDVAALLGVDTDPAVYDAAPDACAHWLAGRLPEAAQASPPCPLQQLAHAVDAAVAGDLAAAEADVAAAGAPSASQPALYAHWRTAQLLLGHADVVVAVDARNAQHGDAADVAVADAAHRGDAKAIDDAVEAYRARYHQVPSWLAARVAWGKRDLAALAAVSPDDLADLEEYAALEVACVNGALDDVVDGLDDLDLDASLVVVAAALRHHRAEAPQLVRALEDGAPPPVVALLRSTSPPSVDALRAAGLPLGVQAGLATLLSERFPAARPLADEAWRLTNGDAFPSLFLATAPSGRR